MRALLVVTVMTLFIIGPKVISAQSRAEISGGVAAVGLENGGDFWGEGLQNVGGVFRVTAAFSRRLALEFLTTYGRRELSREYATAIEGAGIHRRESLIEIALRQSIKAPGWPDSLHAYAIYGVSGFFGTTNYDAGRVRSNLGGYTYAVRAERTSRSIGLQFLSLGLAIQKDLTQSYAIRGEAQVLMFPVFPPVGGHASLTLVLGFGG